jgi:aspartate kinase
MVKNNNKKKTKIKDHRRVVVKFGGSSLADGSKVSNAATMIADAIKRGSRVVVVVSAMGKTTDSLMEIASSALNGTAIGRSDLDDLLSMGERTSVRLLTSVLKSMGVEARYFDPEEDDWPIVTDDTFGDARPLLNECEIGIKKYVEPVLEKRAVSVIPGFIGKTGEGKITTIGRGGSDTTAFILARYLEADEVVLVTDVDGIMTADPKLIGEARPLQQISASELAGLADSGTKFIHNKALWYKPDWVNVRVTNFRKGNLDSGGTLIEGGFPRELDVKLGYNESLDMVTVVGKNIAGNPNIVYKMLKNPPKTEKTLGISANGNSIIFYIPSSPYNKELKALHNVVTETENAQAMAVRRNVALIRVEGVGLENTPGLIGRISNPLKGNGINILGIFTVASSISILVDWERREEAIRLIKESLNNE